MIKTKVVKEKLFGDCTGAIYIDLVHEASETILNADVLHDFTKALYYSIFKTEQWNSFLVYITEDAFTVRDFSTGYNKNGKWFRVYREQDCQFCDQIKIEDEIKEETIAEDVCINEAFDIMRKEIDDNMSDCKFRVKAYQEVYDCLEHYEQAFFFIVNEEESCMITSSSFDMEKYYARYSISYINEEFTIKKYTRGDQE